MGGEEEPVRAARKDRPQAEGTGGKQSSRKARVFRKGKEQHYIGQTGRVSRRGFISVLVGAIPVEARLREAWEERRWKPSSPRLAAVSRDAHLPQ